ncbi:receptor-like protein Cf-9 homolog [Solanum pennellii]|uniref:Receptor-like protein Cf-9 homolog n=1 Tax=Solanum pennellii TaxID=28526 RepID=A0ABM1V1B4_SOLPN|nr:receptor-like protein Cf-9 homolog [Solanum pennellii]
MLLSLTSAVAVLLGPLIPIAVYSNSHLQRLDLSSNNFSNSHIPPEFGNQFQTFENNSYEGNDGLRGFPVTKSCGDHRVSGTYYVVSEQLDDEENSSEFLSDFWKAAFMGYGNGLCIEISMVYFMISTGKTDMACKNHSRVGAKNYYGKEKEV